MLWKAAGLPHGEFYYSDWMGFSLWTGWLIPLFIGLALITPIGYFLFGRENV